MKYLILLLLLPQIAVAQNFEVGVFGGFNFHNRPYNNEYTLADKTQPGYALGAKASLILPRAQIGLGVEMVDILEYNSNLPTYNTREYNYIAKPLITPYLFYNLTHPTTNGYLYAGLMAGPAVASVGVNTLQYNGSYGALSGYTTTYNSSVGYIMGAQAGFLIKASKRRIGISGEFGARYTDYNYKPVAATLQENRYHYRYFYFPVTAGVRYRI